ncbi:MAG: GerA spore germination protein [Desulfotomaculum sp. 46_296]|nr:MAG: GerA spore germination protein [Desulfotomaculum sp. 46_296]
MAEEKKQGFFAKLCSIFAYRPPEHDTFVLPETGDEESCRTAPEKIEKSDLEYYLDQEDLKKAAAEKEKNEKEDKDNVKDDVEVGEEKEIKNQTRASLFRRAKSLKKPGKERQNAAGDKKSESDQGAKEETGISPDINISRDLIKEELNIPTSVDVVVRDFKLNGKVDAFIVFIDGMADRDVINNFILRQLMNRILYDKYDGGSIFEYIKENVLSVNQVTDLTDYDSAVTQALFGLTILFIDGCKKCLAIETSGFEKRGIEKPTTEAVIRGSQESFTENLKTSMIQIRRIIKNKNLINEFLTIGSADRSGASIMYIRGITNPSLVKEVKRRLKSIRTDFAMGDGAIEQFIEDNPWGIMPQVINTERPDQVASHLMQGRVAILSESAPFALVVPVTLASMLSSPEDYYLRWQFGTFLRLVRIFALLIAILLPALYISLVNFHQEMIPTELLVSIASSREAVPFPSIIEILLMEGAFELIREAGLRVPGIIGTTLGIIGALILGQAAVAANIVSPILIIIVAVTALGNFAIPSYSLAFVARLIRFGFIALGATLGFFGMSAGLVIAGALGASAKSFGVPFFAPFWPRTKDSGRFLIRYPVWELERRADEVNALNKIRQPKISRGWVKGEPPSGEKE